MTTIKFISPAGFYPDKYFPVISVYNYHTTNMVSFYCEKNKDDIYNPENCVALFIVKPKKILL